MHLYAVFLPSGLPPEQSAEKAELVRQGFNWRAFLVTPLWALRRGYWLTLGLWAVWTVVVAAIASFAHLEADAALAIYGLGALAFGLEADRIRQARLSRSGFLLHGLTIGESIEEAESLYFGRHLNVIQPLRQSSEARPTPAINGGNASTDLLGLFPQRESEN
jgi:hypothetical protein